MRAQDKDQRSMDADTAKAMLHLLLGKYWKLYPQFHQFLDQSKYKVINKDQWCNILEFSRTINSDLSNYDIDGACKCCHIFFPLPPPPALPSLTRKKKVTPDLCWLFFYRAGYAGRICRMVEKHEKREYNHAVFG